MIPGTLVGISIGTLTFGVLSENDIRLLLGIVTIGFVLWKWLAPQPDSKKDSEPPLDRTKGVLLSALSGFTSFIAHAGGPPITMYLLSKHLSVTCYVATINIFFALTNAVKLVPYAWLGQFTSQSLLASLTLAPLVPLGVWTGLWMQKRINTVWFFRIAQIGLLITGLTLLYQGLNNLL